MTTATTKPALPGTPASPPPRPTSPDLEPIPGSRLIDLDRCTQRFRSNGEVIRVPIRNSSQEGKQFIVWSDLKLCFPGILRVQHGDVYIPFRRDASHYRIKPHGIHFYPDTILDVVYNNKKGKTRSPIESQQQVHQQQPQQQQEQQEQQRAPAGLTDLDRNYLKTVDDLAADIRRRLSTATAAMAATTAIIEAAGVPSGSDHTTDAQKSPPSGEGVSIVRPTDTTTASLAVVGETENVSIIHATPTSVSSVPAITHITEAIQKEEHISPDTTQIEDSIPDRSVDHSQAAKPQETPEHATNPKAVNGSLTHTQEPVVTKETSTEEALSESNIDTIQPSMETEEASPLPATPYQEEDPSKQSSVPEKSLVPVISEATDEKDRPAIFRTSDHVLYKDDPPQQFLTISHVVSQRMRNILLKRSTWIDQDYPKLFVLLPIKRHRAFVDFQINGDDADFDAMSFQDFRVYFLCDCGQVPGFEDQYYPHLEEYDSPSYMIQPSPLIDNPVYLNFVMGVLEMFKFGVVLDGVIHVPKLENQPEMMEMIDCSINFLLFRGIQSSLYIYPTLVYDNDTSDSLSKVVPIEPPNSKQMNTLWRSILVDARPPLGRLRPYLTKSGDTRRLCWNHWDLMSPRGAISMIQQFSTEMTSGRNYFDPHLGSFRGFLKNRDQARLYFRVASVLTMLPVLSFHLDWELTPADEAWVQKFISQTNASAVQVFLQPRPPNVLPSQKQVGLGMGHSQVDLIQAGLTNKRILGFSIESRNPIESQYMNNEYLSFSRSGSPTMGLKSHMAHFRKDRKTGKMDLSLYCTDVDRALAWVRRVMRGFDALSKVRLEVDSVWERTEIRFSPTATDKPGTLQYVQGANRENSIVPAATSTTPADLCKVFASRGYEDYIQIRSTYFRESVLLQSGCVHDLVLGHSSAPQDVLKVREMLKSNYKTLLKLELTIAKNEDPCQIFETFKAPLANCPNLQVFEISHRHAKVTSSTYTWTGLATGDRSQINLDTSTYAGDKIGPLLQKMASCLHRMTIRGIDVAESAILEKVLRQKKGPFKLKSLHLWDLTKFPEQSLEDLKKILLRYSGLEKLTITIDPALKESKAAISRSVDFLIAVAHRVTALSIYGKGAKLLLTELDKRYTEYVETNKNKSGEKLPLAAWPQLVELSVNGGSSGATPGLVFTDAGGPVFLRALMRHRYGFLSYLHLEDTIIPDSVWLSLLADSISMSALVDVRWFQSNPMSHKILDLIVDLFPEEGPEQGKLSLSIEEKGGLTAEQINKAHVLLDRKIRGKDMSGERYPLIMINGFM
ncbi:hypothetical protein BGZ74_005422 [Mortierella antarctica]|nr:hypothetical protein BGZ74_005422 [Mortierella antarctica]